MEMKALQNLLLTTLTGSLAQPLTQFQLDGAVAYITDGQRELMGMLDAKYEAEHAVNFWNTVSGSVTIGAMLMIIGMTVGVSLICCWLKHQWSSILASVERAYAARRDPTGPSTISIMEAQMQATARTSTILVSNLDAPPAYTDIYEASVCL